MQDVWIVPARGHPAEGQAPGFHGTTIRFYDPALEAWQSTWIDPPNGRVRRFIGRAAGTDIELISDDQQPALRWRYTDIRPAAFDWIGEIADAGGTWRIQQRMHAARV